MQTVPATPLKVAATQFQGDEKEYPFYLHIFMNDLLSYGRGASQPWLQGSPDGMTTISWQTWVEINPKTAQQLGVRDEDEGDGRVEYEWVSGISQIHPAILLPASWEPNAKCENVSPGVRQVAEKIVGMTIKSPFPKSHLSRVPWMIQLCERIAAGSIKWSNEA